MQNRYISSKSTHKSIKKNIWQMIACSMINKIIYNWENQSCQIKWYTMVSLYMWGNQNKHGKIRMTMLSKAKWSINIISMSMYSTNMAMKHRKNKILNQDNQSHNQHVKYLIQIYQWSIKKLVILESLTKIINQHDQPIWSTCQCPKWKLGNSRRAIKRWVPTDRLTKRHVCFTLSSSLTL